VGSERACAGTPLTEIAAPTATSIAIAPAWLLQLLRCTNQQQTQTNKQTSTRACPVAAAASLQNIQTSTDREGLADTTFLNRKFVQNERQSHGLF